MRLYELFGVKKYRDMKKFQVLSDLEERGIEWLGEGKYASVIGHPS